MQCSPQPTFAERRPRRIGTGILVVCSALTFATFPGCSSGDGAPPRTWKHVMNDVDDAFDAMTDAIDRQPAGDLELAATKARTAAELVRLGYGPYVRADIEGFADLARRCESWLLSIALEADQGHAELARDLLHARDECKSCHDRSRARQW